MSLFDRLGRHLDVIRRTLDVLGASGDMLRLLDRVKVWRDDTSNQPFPADLRAEIDALLARFFGYDGGEKTG